jgi:hypothetical protein
MLNPVRKLVLAASIGAGIASFASVASALPVLDALAIRNAAPPTPVEEVQWRGRWGWGWGAPVAAGVVAGANVLVGGSARTVALRFSLKDRGLISARRLCTTAIRRRRQASAACIPPPPATSADAGYFAGTRPGRLALAGDPVTAPARRSYNPANRNLSQPTANVIAPDGPHDGTGPPTVLSISIAPAFFSGGFLRIWAFSRRKSTLLQLG